MRNSHGGQMKKLPFKKIDAFATNRSDGNPAGYINLRKIAGSGFTSSQNI